MIPSLYARMERSVRPSVYAGVKHTLSLAMSVPLILSLYARTKRSMRPSVYASVTHTLLARELKAGAVDLLTTELVCECVP